MALTYEQDRRIFQNSQAMQGNNLYSANYAPPNQGYYTNPNPGFNAVVATMPSNTQYGTATTDYQRPATPVKPIWNNGYAPQSVINARIAAQNQGRTQPQQNNAGAYRDASGVMNFDTQFLPASQPGRQGQQGGYVRPSYNNYGYNGPQAAFGNVASMIGNAFNGGTTRGAGFVIPMGGGGGGMNPALAQNLMASYDNSYQEAKDANESRYNQILGGPQPATRAQLAQQAQADQARAQVSASIAGLRSQGMERQAAELERANAYLFQGAGNGTGGKSMLGQAPAATTNMMSKGGSPRMATAAAPIDPQAAYMANTNGGYKERYARNMAQLDGLGTQAQKDINRDYTRMQGRQDQQLVNRGLANSTIRSTVARGVEEDRQAANARLNEQLRRERIGWDTQLSGDQLQFMERRQDPYPSMDQYIQTMTALGQAGGGGGGGIPNLVYSGSTGINPQPMNQVSRWSAPSFRYA